MKKPGKTQRLLACFGEPSRFRVVTALLAGERCVSDLALVVGLSQSCTTRHLQALVREGLVTGKREGKRVMFRVCLEEPRIAELIQWAASSPRRSSLGHGHMPAAARGQARDQSADHDQPGPSPDGYPPAFDAGSSGVDESEGVAMTEADADDETETPSGVPRRGDLEDFLL